MLGELVPSSTPSTNNLIKKKLRGFLEGNLPEWSLICNDKESFLSKLLVPSSSGISHASLIALLKTLGPRQVCQYQFKPNDIVWICRDCQKDETCVLCNECYIDSDHEGHDVLWYFSAAGGCCDCGDPDAWDPRGFCDKHGKKHEDPVSFIPSEMKENVEVMCDEIIDQFLRFCGEYCDIQRLYENISDDQPYSIYLYYDEFHTLEEFQRVLLSDALEMVLDGPPENSSEITLMKTGWLKLRSNLSGDETRSAVGYLLAENFTVRAFTLSFRKRYDAILSAIKFLQSITLACDGMCKIICGHFPSDRLSQMINYDMFLDRDLGKLFHDLLMSLMADQSFKMVSAVAYSKSFKKLCKDYNDGHGIAGLTMFSLSVQFLNREVFVHEISYHENYLDACTAVLSSIICEIRKDSNKFLKSLKISKRRYSAIVADLKVIGTIPDISRLFLTKNLIEWMDILEYMQLLHPQTRMRDQHVQFEDTLWMASFNLTLGISSLFDYMCNWFAKPDAQQLVTKYSQSATGKGQITLTQTSVVQSLSYVCDRCIQWQGTYCGEKYLLAMDMLSSANMETDFGILSNFTNIHTSINEGDYSFHIPMHRFLAHMLLETFKYPHLLQSITIISERLLSFFPSAITSSTDAIASPTFSLSNVAVMLQFVLRPISFAQQIKRNLWRRNGSSMFDQVMNYSEPPFCRIYRDLDAVLAQICLVNLPAKSSLWYIFSSFDVLPCVLFPSKHLVSKLKENHCNLEALGDYLEYATALTTDSLQLIINLISELPTEQQEKVSDRLIPLLRRELIHVLASGSVTYSKLQETMAIFHDTDKLTSEQIDTIVADVSNRINPSNVNASPLYVLKKENWQHYDPCFSRLSDQMHSKALELRPKFEGNAPISSPPFPCHPYFDKLRSSLLFDEYFMIAIRNLVYIAARNYTSKSIYTRICHDWILSNSDKFFPKVIQLMTLSIYEAQRYLSATTEKQNSMERFFSYFCDEVSMQSVIDVDAPSLLEAMYDIYVSNEYATLGNDYYALGWLIDELKELNLACKSLAAKLERKSSSVHSRKSDLDAMKEKSQANAMQSIQAAAAQFMAMMDELSDDDEDEEEQKEKEHEGTSSALGIAELNEQNEGVDNMMNRRSLNTQSGDNEGEPVDLGDLLDDDEFEVWDLGMGLGRIPPRSSLEKSSEGRNSESSAGDIVPNENEEQPSNKQCIICMSSNRSSTIGLLGLCQPSNVSWPKSHRPESIPQDKMFCPDPLPKVDHTRILTPDLDTCNLRIGFCGHYMHESCHLKYFYSCVRRSIFQDNMMYEPALGYFPCPLCKKLCNCFLPSPSIPALFRTTIEVPIEEIDGDAKMEGFNLLSSSKSDWVEWLEHFVILELNSTISLINNHQVQDFIDNHRFIKHLYNSIGPLATGLLMNHIDTNVDDKVKFLEYLISCVSYSLSCDLLDGEVPGYFLENVQSAWSTNNGIHESGITASPSGSSAKQFKFHGYAPGQDDLRNIAEMIPLIAIFAITCHFDKLTMTSILQRVAGQCIAPASAMRSTEQEKYWLQNPSSPLLTLPLLDVIVFVISMSTMKYKFVEDSESDMSDNEETSDGHIIPFEKTIPWLCIAAFAQIMLIDEETEITGESTFVINKLAGFIELLEHAWQRSPLGDKEKSFCKVGYANFRKKIFRWTTFLRSVIHILLRVQQDQGNVAMDGVGNWLFEVVEEDSLSEDLVFHHMSFLGLDTLLSPSSLENESQHDLVPEMIESWFSALAFDATCADDGHFGTDTVSVLPILGERRDVDLSAVEPITSASDDRNDAVPSSNNREQHNNHRIAMNIRNPAGEMKSVNVKFYPLFEKYRYYPSLKAPSLFTLPRDFSKLHASMAVLCSFDFPAVCLQCGAILDASGKGQCLSHSYLCSKGMGIFFTVQDCRIILSHGPRCAYFASPYTDKYGEIRHTQRGKPLQLDNNRFDALNKMRLKHSIPSEVFSNRSTAQRVIINGYY